MLTKIASRNIWRSRKRSLIIIAAVSIGLWAGIFMMAFYNGMIEQRINSAITDELSHIQVHHPEFRKEYDIKYRLSEGRKVVETIRKDSKIKAVAGRVILKGMIASASGSSGITINGIMPEAEQVLTNLNGKIIKGNYFNPQKTNEIILSEKLSKKLKLNLNKKTILTFQDIDGNLASGAFRITAIYKTVNGPYDDSNVFVKITDIDSLAGIPNAINEIAILLKSNAELEEIQKKLKHKFPKTEVKNWMEISPELGLTISVGDQMVFIFMGIILLALAFGIVNTMMMAVLERTREIGMLLALGMNKFKIFMMILLETLFLIVAGCPVGILLAFVSIGITQLTGIDFSNFSEAYSSFGYSSIIYPSLTARQFGIIMLLVFITALFSALFPARRALKLNPAESLKK
ncbi:ABC-type lipoprotein release transport system permease subunit [Flavobacterium limicola]|uniref:ABC-type lipoprotein release transport system permease subunit n=1 Tax=Flavobacterium limicola TaxID=180441 RepID=A0A495RT38_9FLAO|nr:FtsX-like permease family protein [Flavobacterium limicola]RKS90306.1 ABC-type lipoprotein release transport system permease subunit [Flavobacterium limicola]